MVQAIPTTYSGIRFRSRTEVRWAVFFDALKVKWTYEPEGFETKAGGYLPDFWIADWRCWIEIKPEWSNDLPLSTYADKLGDVLDATKKDGVIIFGAPDLARGNVLISNLEDGYYERGSEFSHFATCRFCDGHGMLAWTEECRECEPGCWDNAFADVGRVDFINHPPDCAIEANRRDCWSERFVAVEAYEAARSHSFKLRWDQ